MKTVAWVIGAIAVIAIAVFAYFMVDIDQTQQAALPDVDISVEEGQMPEFDVDVGTISIEETEMEVEVPEVEVTTTTETITVPTLEVTTPEEDVAATE